MRKFLILLLILGVLGGAGYYAYSRNLGPANWVKQTFGISGDARTTANVKTALGLSKRVAPFNIGVQTTDGVVTLNGQVSSEGVKSLAGEIASETAGVKEVNNEILVDRAAQPPTESALVDDLEIKTAILEALSRSQELAGKKIDVKVENRMVLLSGSVDTPAQRNGAAQAAGAVDGVGGVTNELAVTNPAPATEPPATAVTADPDADLAKRVKFELYETGAFDTLGITVQAKAGNVTLSGSVRNRAEQVLATHVAQGTPGTNKVDNKLQVTASPARRSKQSAGN
jgi:hyperosmotically inducible periplasmic protein